MSDHPILDRRLLVADTVISHLAADEADLRARLEELEIDNATLREIISTSLFVAHDLTVERNDYRRRYHHALDENRRLRADLAACQRGEAA